MNQIAYNFVREFAKSRDLDPTRIVTIELHADKGLKYSYLDKFELITVEELHKWDL